MKLRYQTTTILLLLVAALFCSCKKGFLDAKPSTTIVAPSSLSDLQALLENTQILNLCTPALSLMASDDYVFVDYNSWLSTNTKTERNSYIWAKDLYAGESAIPDWNVGYGAIFYCNNILETLPKIEIKSQDQNQYNLIKGWALFLRAYVLYDMVRNFANTYDPSTAATDLGLPIRLKAEIDELVSRSSLKQTYEQIFADLAAARQLLDTQIPVNSNRPSRAAVYALNARIYLSMRDYTMAEKFADSTLAINNKLIDYNTLSKTATAPFKTNNDETLFSSCVVIDRYPIIISSSSNARVTVNPELISLYNPKDLRLNIFFGKNATTGNLYFKRKYLAELRTFTGLATDEIYLIKAECLARRNQVSVAMSWLNALVKKRFAAPDFLAIAASDPTDALNKVLLERRKELAWRSLRWADLKRLNKEGSNITLTRSLNGVTYTLPPNDPRYIFPIPQDEIAISGLQQNNR